MEKLIKILVLGLFALGFLYGQEKQVQRKIVKTKEFVSDNKEYIVTVGYEKWGGEGKAYYTIKNKEGEIISEFTADMAPAEVFVSNNGNNLVAFGGDWHEISFLNKMVFYGFKGNIIKKYELNIPVAPYLNAIRFSKEGDILVMGLWYDLKDYLTHMDKEKIIYKNVIVLFDVRTGDIIKQFPVEGITTCMSRIVVSDNAEWILIGGPENPNKNWNKRIVLVDKNGKKYWEKLWKRKTFGGVVTPLYISPDGKIFEFKKGNKKYIYKNIKGKVSLEKVIDIKKGGK